MLLDLVLAFVFRIVLIIAAARLIYDLITPITPTFLIVLASLVGVRIVLARRGL